MKAAVTILESQLAALFRAFIKVDRDLQVISVGPFFLARDTSVVAGAQLAELFSLRHDRDDEQEPPLSEAIAAMADTPERLELFCKSKNIRLAGIVFTTGDGFLLALNIVPEDFVIEGQGLTISDFSQIDASVPALTLIGMQRAMLAEAREAAIDLAKAQSNAMDLLDRTQRLGTYIVHDLTNYLSIIRLNVANLASPGGNAEASRGAIEAATRHVSDLVLSLERLTGHRDVEVPSILIDETIRSNLAFLTTALPADLKLDFIGGVPQVSVRVGRTELITMLTNVIVHARTAMTVGSAITITTYRAAQGNAKPRGAAPQGDWIAVEIIHEGQGIDDETVRLMLDPQTSVRPDGPEVLLRSVRNWARSVGGDVDVTALPSARTDICLYLPVSSDAAESQTDAVPLAAGIAPRPSAGARVLVVEDEIHALDAVIEILRMQGYHATPASNAAQAIEALDAGEFDILLTDVVMPERSGVDLAYEVEARDPRMGIILMSGYLPDESLLQPHWRMLRKPLDLGLLSQTLAAAQACQLGHSAN